MHMENSSTDNERKLISKQHPFVGPKASQCLPNKLTTFLCCLFKKTAIIFITIIIFPIFVLADDYRWTKEDPGGEQQIIPVDPKICKLYEENLHYFARKNTPMSCYRPIASHLKDRIKDVEWEDVDPGIFPELFRTIVMNDEYLDINKKSEDIIRDSVKSNIILVIKKIKVFRKAKLSLVGRIRRPDAYNHDPEKYWIVQYGFNDISPDNPDSLQRCKPIRGGGNFTGSNLKLYIVSAEKKELTKDLWNLLRPSNTGQYLKMIDDRLFVENMGYGAGILLNEVAIDLADSDTVCEYAFKKSKIRDQE